MDAVKATTRKGSAPIKVYCLPEERARIEANAASAGVSKSTFLLNVGQGYRVRGIVDYQQVREMARIHGDLGRLGGLLKMWLSNDARAARFGPDTIWALMNRIDARQEELGRVMKTVVRPRAK